MRVRAALHLRAREVGGICWVRRDAYAMHVDLIFPKEEHHTGSVVKRQLAPLLCLDERGTAQAAETGLVLHIADPEMKCERLHFCILLEWPASPCGDIGVTCAINHRLCLHLHEPVLVRDGYGRDAPTVALHVADEGIKQHGEVAFVFLKKPIEQQFELKRVRDRRIVFRHRLRVRRAHSRLRQQFQRDAAHDDAIRRDVRDAIEIR